MHILLSIKPRFGEGILNGTKKYELRKQIWKDDVEKAVLYFSSPVKAIMGHFTVGTIIVGSAQELADAIGDGVSMNKESIARYFGDRDVKYAIQILEPVKYDEPVPLKEKYPDLRAPQSFRYIPEGHILIEDLLEEQPVDQI